jgi:putative ABC transport system permease protein
MAGHVWLDEDPVGQHFEVLGADPALANRSLTTIGVVRDVRATSLERETASDYYVSCRQGISMVWRRHLVVKVAGDPSALIASLRRVMKEQAPDVPQDLMTMSARVRASVARRLFAGTALGFIAATGLLLVFMGVYGVLSFVVSWRVREIGIRMALGASARRVRVEILRAILGPVAVGLVMGIGAALLLGKVLQALVFGVSPRDPLTLSLALLCVTAAAVAAGIVPAWRAARTDPACALRP